MGAPFLMPKYKLEGAVMEKENRSCKGHKPRYKGALLNCATCRRYNFRTGKCREMLWVKEWVRDEDTERSVFDAFDRMMRGNRGVWIGNG